jgi:hypothetical protein
MLNDSAEYERDISSAKFTAISRKFLLLRYQVFVGYYQRALVDKSGMILTQM